MALRRAAVFATVLLASCEPGLAQGLEPISRQVFAALLSSYLQPRGVSISPQTDCDHALINCKVLRLPETLEIWLSPNRNGYLASVQVNFDAAKGNANTVFASAREICSAAIAILAISVVEAPSLERPFERARTAGHWEGAISGQATSVWINTAHAFGSCEVTSARK
jgi:hypothetical protein